MAFLLTKHPIIVNEMLKWAMFSISRIFPWKVVCDASSKNLHGDSALSEQASSYLVLFSLSVQFWKQALRTHASENIRQLSDHYRKSVDFRTPGKNRHKFYCSNASKFVNKLPPLTFHTINKPFDHSLIAKIVAIVSGPYREFIEWIHCSAKQVKCKSKQIQMTWTSLLCCVCC